LRGDLIESLRYNAMVIPLCTLLAVSLGQLGYQAFRQQRLRLATLLAWIWFTVLIAAWLAKLFIAEPA
jgi:uncharacterized membrane protein